MTGLMFFTFWVCWLARALLAYALYRVELLGSAWMQTCASCARR